jgi:hypothetical protein
MILRIYNLDKSRKNVTRKETAMPPQTREALIRRQLELEEDLRQLDAKIDKAASQVRIATIAFLIGLVVALVFHWMLGGFIVVVSLLSYFTGKRNASHYQRYRDAAYNDLVNVRVAAA